jgi:L-lactate dehydrogenase complex protein LldF
MDISSLEFKSNVRRALADERLRGAFAQAMRHSDAAARACAAERADWESLRARGRAIKEDVLDHLDRYLEQFAAQVESRGGRVHWARDAAEARGIIVGLARQRGITLVVKGKSMVSEEIDLNPALAAAGVRPVEGDLGEYIVQLAGQPPSHLTAPAIHLSRGEIADLFHRELGVDRNEDPVFLCQVARKILRDVFRQAGMGFSGVNFAVAETGTIVLHENEGNIRLATSLPRIHVALLGIEKLVPTLADLAVVMRLLPRASTGQRITSYVSWITGPRRADEDDGPEELHVVLLDNGRTRILADPAAREALLCIRCGACLNTCPVYRLIGGYAYGWIIPGPIGSILTPELLGLARAPDLPFASSLCGACRDVCPVKVDLPGLLLHLRHLIKEGDTGPASLSGASPPLETPVAPGDAVGGVPPDPEAVAAGRGPHATLRARFERFVMAAAGWWMRSPWRFRLGGRLARCLLWPISRGGKVRWLPPPFNAWTACRDFPLPAKQTFRRWWKENEERTSNAERMTNHGGTEDTETTE